MKLLLLLAFMLARCSVYLGIVLFAVLVTFIAKRWARPKADPVHCDRLRHFQGSWITAVVMSCLLMLFTLGAEAQSLNSAMAQPNIVFRMTNFTGNVIAGGVSTNYNVFTNVTSSNNVTIKPNNGLTVLVHAHASTTTTSNLTIFADVTHDGINYTTNAAPWHFWSNNIALNGTAGVEQAFVIDKATLNNLRFFAIDAASNGMASGTATIDWIDVSYSNQ